MNSRRIRIIYRNDFERIVEESSVRNYNSLKSWLEDFNEGVSVSPLTLFGQDLGSNFSINKNNVKLIEYID